MMLKINGGCGLRDQRMRKRSFAAGLCHKQGLVSEAKMPPNGPDEWRARIGHWENRKLRWYQAHSGSRTHVPLYVHLERVISEAPLLCVLLLLSSIGKVSTGV